MKRLFSLFLILLSFIVVGANFDAGRAGCAKASTTSMMAIVIDDFGSYDQSGVEKMLSSSAPLTCAVMPNVDHTEDNLEKIKNCGRHEII